VSTALQVPAVLLAAFALSQPALPQARAQDFEGIVRIRLIEVDVDRATEIRNAQVNDLLALPTEYLLQLKSRDGSPAVSTSLRTYLIRGRSIRMEADQGDESSYTLIDLAAGTIRIVSPADETYYEISIAELTRPLFPMLRSGGYMVRPLNQTRNVNGVEATGYEAVAEDNRVRAWLTRKYPALTRLLEDLAHAVSMPTATAEDRLLGLAQLGAPVLVQLVDMDGKKLDDYEVQEIIAIAERPLDPRLFLTPEGYQRVDH
jgi:hypothetical protein